MDSSSNSDELVANIRQVGAPRSLVWYIDHSHPDLPRRLRKTLRTKDPVEAQRRANVMLAEALQAAAKSQAAPLARGSSRKPRAAFSGFARWWLDNVVVLRSDATRLLYERIMRLYWVPAFGAKDLRRIALADVQQAIAEMCTRLEPSTIHTYVRVLGSLMSSALDNDYVDDIRYLRRLVLPRIDAKPAKLLSLEETRQFLDWVQDNDPYWYAPLMMAVRLGPRRQELTELLWEHIDIEAQTVTFFAPKTGKTRIVPMSPAVTAAVAAHPRHVHGRHFITRFSGRLPGPYRDGESLLRVLKRLLRRSGSPRITFHALRHMAVSHLDSQGATTRGLQAMLGHASIRTTERYVHPKPDALRLVMKAVDEASG
jgi:integrase